MPWDAVGASVNEPKTHRWCRPCRLGWGQSDGSTIRSTACFWEYHDYDQKRSNRHSPQLWGARGSRSAKEVDGVNLSDRGRREDDDDKTQGSGLGRGMHQGNSRHPRQRKGPGLQQRTGGKRRGWTTWQWGTRGAVRAMAIVGIAAGATTASAYEPAWTGGGVWNTTQYGEGRTWLPCSQPRTEDEPDGACTAVTTTRQSEDGHNEEQAKGQAKEADGSDWRQRLYATSIEATKKEDPEHSRAQRPMYGAGPPARTTTRTTTTTDDRRTRRARN